MTRNRYRAQSGFRWITARFMWIPAVIVVSALTLSALPGQEAHPFRLPPGVEITIQAHPLQATVGDPIQIDLDITIPRGYQIQVPDLQGQLGEFTVLQSFPGPDVPSPAEAGKTPTPPSTPAGDRSAGVYHHHIRVIAAVYKTGGFEFPSLPLILRDAQGGSSPLPTPTVKIRIASVIEGNAPELLDLKKQAVIEEPVRWLLWLVLGGLALAVMMGLWWWSRRRRARPLFVPSAVPDIDPLDLAEASLRDLIGRGLLQKGLIKQFYVYLSDILKKALEATYRIPTVEKTTAEIVSALADSPQNTLNPEDRQQIEGLLLSCDMVKFARYLPSPTESDAAVEAAFHLLAGCRSKWRPAPPPAEPGAGTS